MNIESGISPPMLADGAIVYGNGIVGPSDEDKKFFNGEHAMSDEQQRKRGIERKSFSSPRV